MDSATEDNSPVNSMTTSIDWKRLNAFGPYSMGVWRNSAGVKVGNQESMDGRAEVMLETLRSQLLSHYSFEQLSKMTIVDIGCHDGWLLHNLSDLPFKEMVGVEPRQKNILKGTIVRDELGLTNNIEFVVGDVATLGNRTFDIVVSTGVLYHVESIPAFLRALKGICTDFLFIESRTINSGLVNGEVVKQSELVDLPYKFDQHSVGMSMHKFESSYSDGSARDDTVVSLPTPEAILMYLQSLDFQEIAVVLGPEAFRSAIKRKDRPLDGVCITARILASDTSTSSDGFRQLGMESARRFEAIYEHVALPEDVVRLVLAVAVGDESLVSPLRGSLEVWLQPGSFHDSKLESMIVSSLGLDANQSVIFSDLKYGPLDKAELELAKLDFFEGNYQSARDRLDELVRRPNADWRSTYRGYFFLSLIGQQTSDSDLSEDALAALLTCNPQHPSLLDGSLADALSGGGVADTTPVTRQQV